VKVIDHNMRVRFFETQCSWYDPYRSLKVNGN